MHRAYLTPFVIAGLLLLTSCANKQAEIDKQIAIGCKTLNTGVTNDEGNLFSKSEIEAFKELSKLDSAYKQVAQDVIEFDLTMDLAYLGAQTEGGLLKATELISKITEFCSSSK